MTGYLENVRGSLMTNQFVYFTFPELFHFLFLIFHCKGGHKRSIGVVCGRFTKPPSVLNVEVDVDKISVAEGGEVCQERTPPLPDVIVMTQ